MLNKVDVYIPAQAEHSKPRGMKCPNTGGFLTPMEVKELKRLDGMEWAVTRVNSTQIIGHKNSRNQITLEACTYSYNFKGLNLGGGGCILFYFKCY